MPTERFSEMEREDTNFYIAFLPRIVPLPASIFSPCCRMPQPQLRSRLAFSFLIAALQLITPNQSAEK
jgi:hypothetical protein